jgi:cyclophilin family peptidyl-prolyl cis-trans isomerase
VIRRISIGVAAVLAMAAASCSEPKKIVVPEVFRVKFETSQGDFTVEATRAWSPHGVDRFHELVNMRYFDEGRFFRVLQGIHRAVRRAQDFRVHDVWRKLHILDDPPKEKNRRGTLAFAKSDPNTRATEIFINLADNAILDEQVFVPFRAHRRRDGKWRTSFTRATARCDPRESTSTRGA